MEKHSWFWAKQPLIMGCPPERGEVLLYIGRRQYSGFCMGNSQWYSLLFACKNIRDIVMVEVSRLGSSFGMRPGR